MLIVVGLAATSVVALALLRAPWWAAPLASATVLGITALIGGLGHGVLVGPGLAAAVVFAMLAALTGGSTMARAAFAVARRDGEHTVTPGPLRGGLLIGILERAAVVAAILTRWPEGIAIVLAVKGLARYPELREPSASEQFIIGTFASVLWAAACAGTVLLGC